MSLVTDCAGLSASSLSVHVAPQPLMSAATLLVVVSEVTSWPLTARIRMSGATSPLACALLPSTTLVMKYPESAWPPKVMPIGVASLSSLVSFSAGLPISRRRVHVGPLPLMSAATPLRPVSKLTSWPLTAKMRMSGFTTLLSCALWPSSTFLTKYPRSALPSKLIPRGVASLTSCVVLSSAIARLNPLASSCTWSLQTSVLALMIADTVFRLRLAVGLPLTARIFIPTFSWPVPQRARHGMSVDVLKGC